ncbi:flagellar basal body rod modification protein [Reichenbachiella sp.]|uniref:flagellar basal body rod modification protein n=1 Tax=Reichenbachiella sp. TaxID=2184521 RepID=UPI003B5B8F1F
MKVKIVLLGFSLSILIYSCNTNSPQNSHPPLPTEASVIGTKEKPNARFDYERQMLMDPKTSEVPRDIHHKEFAFAKKLRSNQTFLRTKQQNWTLAGPSNVGGRTRALAFDVREENILLAGGVSGGMWRSTNSGLSWARTTQPSALNSITSIVQDPRIGKRDTWYYGTGELDGNSARASGAPYRGDGIFKSTDNGQSWDLLSSTSTNNPASFDSPFNYIWNLAINPVEAFSNDVVYAAIYGNIVRSSDGGASWEKLLGEPNLLEDNSGDLNNSEASFYTNVMVTPTGKMFAYLSTSTGNGFSGINKGIFYSENGTDWSNITPAGFNSFSERLVMSYAPSNDNIIYFLVEGTSVQLWRYQNGSWSDRSDHIPNDDSELEAFDSQGSYNMTIKVHPSDPNTVFIGGTNLYRSTDGFTTSSNIAQIGGYDTESVSQPYENHHPDQHELIFLSGTNQMLSSNDGGVFKTFNNKAETVSWSSLNNGYVTSQYYTIAVSKDQGRNEMIGGMQDNGTYIKTVNGENPSWNSVLGGDGSYCATTPGNQFWYMSFQEAGIFKISYEDDGSIDTWAKVDPIGVYRDNYLFITPFVLDPNNYNRMYLAGDSAVWRNDNLSQIKPFKQVPTSTNWSVVYAASDGSENITALDISTKPAHTLFFGTYNVAGGTPIGTVYKSENANSPSAQSEAIFTHTGYISNITIDPDDASRILVCFSNYKIPSLFLSEDGGDTFTDVGGNLEENPDGTGNGPSIRWSEIIALNDGSYKYFVGTSMGLFSTTKLIANGTVWQQDGTEKIGNSVVTMMDYRSSDGKNGCCYTWKWRFRN